MVKTKGKVVCRQCTRMMPHKNNTTNLYVYLEQHHKKHYAKLRPCILTQSSNSEGSTLMKHLTMLEHLWKLQPLAKTTGRYKQLVEAMVQFIS